MLKDHRKNAFRDAKSAVRAFAKEPSDRKATQVQLARDVFKEAKDTMWRQHFEMWLRSK